MITNAARAALIGWAKQKAPVVASRIAVSIPVDHIIGDATWEQLAALVVVLAESADPVRLRIITSAQDVMIGRDTDRAVTLRAAHAEVRRLRYHNQPVPSRIAALEREYQQARERPANAA